LLKIYLEANNDNGLKKSLILSWAKDQPNPMLSWALAQQSLKSNSIGLSPIKFSLLFLSLVIYYKLQLYKKKQQKIEFLHRVAKNIF
jgi:hypothetical protein